MALQQKKANFDWQNYAAIILDFDGVIKESVQVKSLAFYRLFLSFGKEVAAKVVAHHENNGGMSREVKIPFYLKEFARQEVSEQEVARYKADFRRLTQEQTQESPWVQGAKEFLHSCHQSHALFMASGTPQAELEDLVQRLAIEPYLREIWGYPPSKKEGLAQLLERHALNKEKTVFVGDSLSDFAAAKENGLPFVWRRKPEREEDGWQMQKHSPVFVMDDFVSEVTALEFANRA